ncbi:hypothetical protein B4N84_00495, partial [Flavobacterium sp. IR1]
ECGLLVDQRRAEDRLQRAHQAPVVLADIGVNGAGTEQYVALALVVEEDGGWDQCLATLNRCERRRVAAHHADGRVGGAEVEAAGGH